MKNLSNIDFQIYLWIQLKLPPEKETLEKLEVSESLNVSGMQHDVGFLKNMTSVQLRDEGNQ